MESLIKLILDIGPFAIFAVVFAESGLLIGFFLPGDSLLFTAGFFAYKGLFSLPLLLIGCFIAAVLGDSVGYAFGRRVGRKLFEREDSRFFHKKNLLRAQEFYEKHGGKAIVLARFMPIVRTFAPIVAGVGTMEYRRFLFFNVIGGFLWAVGVTTIGYLSGQLLGEIIDIDKFLLPIIALIVLISVAPVLYHVLKEPENRTAIMNTVRGFLKRETPVAAEIENVDPGA